MAKVHRKHLSNSNVEKMSGSGTGSGSSNPSSSPAPKILLAKPGLVNSGGGDDESLQYHRARLPAIGSLNLLSDSWDFHIDRFLPFLTENTDFKVVGVIGPPGVGKSTIMNELYGFDGTSPGMLPPFVIQSEENRAMARHCTTGIEPRISSERLMLLDTQPVFSSSVLAEMMRPDGSSTIPVLSSENISAELALEVMAIQLAVLLLSICHVLLVVSDGVHDDYMWNLLLTADLLKHGIPDPSSLSTPHFQSSGLSEKESKDKATEIEEYMSTPVFVHTKLQGEDCSPRNIEKLRRGLAEYFSSSSFTKGRQGNMRFNKRFSSSASIENNNLDSTPLKLFVIPMKYQDDTTRLEYESYVHALQKLRDKVLSMNCSSFARNISEREWLKNTAKIWELVKSSSVIAEYSKMLQSSGMFRR